METLKEIRHGENVHEITDQYIDASNTAYVTVKLQNRNMNSILVFMRHSDDIINVVLKSIDPNDSGYVFFASELEIDPLNNNIVPKHRIATNGEIDDFTSKNIPKDKLPILQMLDPVRRWHNFPKGSIVAIERHSGHTYFRRVK